MTEVKATVKNVVKWVDCHPRLGWYLFLLMLLQFINLAVSTANLLA